MHKAARWAVATALLLCLEASASELRPLFQLARNKNANVVEYAARVEPDGFLEEERPVDAYWLLRATDGHKEGLSWLEQVFAYGFSSTLVQAREVYTLKLVSFDRTLELHNRNGRYEAVTKIGGIPSRLTRIFVTADEAQGKPNVVSVELYGQSLATSTPTYERISH